MIQIVSLIYQWRLSMHVYWRRRLDQKFAELCDESWMTVYIWPVLRVATFRSRSRRHPPH
jgi:hypothetical protein